ncbi:glutamyl-tRNA reductase [Halanaerobiaceae bacterium Z-7014]|uniref:Glutamyl-tRNA reductase n=1 Tax=Halonatronomonas betaini TaxID=2778430 RepID=A0A931AW58_9FIRM|nr:glutamyl-tRNA reductase [Halonatronomonas betaini]MBF8437784.1 glutamyl-tRNA reductase [Halonatronomonas betaini]
MGERLILLGLNHKTASVATREKVAFSEAEKIEFIGNLTDCHFCNGAVILATCNRTEIYMSTEDISDGRKLLINNLEGYLNEDIRDCTYFLTDDEIANHLFEVATGLDSMIQGEPQILGQVREAYEFSAGRGFCSTYLHELFNRAIRTGKRARSETGISEKAASVAYAAVELLKGEVSDIRDSKVLVIGAGEMGQIVLKNLLKLELKELAITNRTRARIQDFIQGEAVKDDFANCSALKVVDWDDKIKKINEYDIVVSSTNAPHPVLYGDRVIPELEMGKRQLPLYMIDLAMPRDIEAAIGEIENVELYMLDDLQEIVAENMKFRENECEAVYGIIAEEKLDWQDWCQTRKAVPLIKKLSNKAREISREEENRAINNLEGCNDQETIKEMGYRIINRLLHHPRIRLKEMLQEADSAEEEERILEIAFNLFGLENEGGN